MAYGARLESVLGESPRGFESPILRHKMHPLPVVSCTRRGGLVLDAVQLRPHPYLLRRGTAAVLAFFVPAFGVVYFLTVPHGPWVVVLVAQLLVSAAFSYSVFAYARLGVWVSATSISERGYFGITRTFAAEEIGSVLLLDTFHGGWAETVPQLFVTDKAGRQVIRLRGQFWSRDTMQAVATTLDTGVTELAHPISTGELHASYPGLLYWFERRPILAGLLFGGTLVVGGIVLYLILAALGRTV